MAVLRTLLGLLFAACALCAPAAAQLAVGTEAAPAIGSAPRASGLPGTRTYLGLNLSRSRYNVSCGTTALLCDDSDRVPQFYAGSMIGNFWGVELGYLDMGRIARAGTETRAQGLNLSLVGKAQVARSFGVFGKVGTTYGRSDTSAMGASSSIATGAEYGFGLSYGAGVSVDFTPRLSARLEWDSNDFRFAGGGRDPVRSTSLGLQYRY
jgi:OOP family OmpA-OmpF porin